MINFLVALASEAKPIIHALKLKRDANVKALTVYSNPPYRLAVTGVGKVAAAGTVGMLQGLDGEQQAWINVGVAGHGNLDVGTAVLAYKIIDGTTGQTWYPQVLFAHEFSPGVVNTVEQNQDTYSDEFLFDMEAAGIAATVSRISCLELLQCIKIVSDNRQQDYHQLNAGQVASLVESQLVNIEGLAHNILDLQQQLSHWQGPPEIYTALIEKWHFTHSERHQLLKELNRLRSYPEKTQGLLACTGAKQVMQTLRSLAAIHP